MCKGTTGKTGHWEKIDSSTFVQKGFRGGRMGLKGQANCRDEGHGPKYHCQKICSKKGTRGERDGGAHRR